MKGRNPTAEEKRYMAAVAEMGCIICELFLDEFTPGAIHHIDGKTKPGAHFKSLCMCDRHHQYKDNQKPPRWISRHGDGRYAFEQKYYPEQKLLEITYEKLADQGCHFDMGEAA